jgi:cytochrome c oxidase cbb3-type subunit 3
MSSPCLSGAAALLSVAALLLVACKREERDLRPRPSAAKLDQTITLSTLQPGQPSAAVKTRNPAEARAYDVAEGKRLFRAYNCNGCHANGGGGMGPALMDDQWIYGSDPANIAATILEGRPNGMPSFRGKVPEYQLWQIVGYVRSLSGQVAKDVAPGRSDHLAAKYPESQTEQAEPQESGIPPSATRPQ